MDQQGDQIAVPVARPAMFRMPAEVSFDRASDLVSDVQAALDSGTRTLVIDLTATVYCDEEGFGEIVEAYLLTRGSAAELRVVIPSGSPLLRNWKQRGLDGVMPRFISATDALPEEPRRLAAAADYSAGPAGGR